MTKGTLKWFNAKKGYGFICPENGEKDVFIHITALEKAGIEEGDTVSIMDIEFDFVD